MFFRVFRVFTVVEESGLGVIQREKLPKKMINARFPRCFASTKPIVRLKTTGSGFSSTFYGEFD